MAARYPHRRPASHGHGHGHGEQSTSARLTYLPQRQATAGTGRVVAAVCICWRCFSRSAGDTRMDASDVHLCEQPWAAARRDAEIELLASLLDGIQGGGGALVLYGEPESASPGFLPWQLVRARTRLHVAERDRSAVRGASAVCGPSSARSPARFRAADLPAAQRAALDAAFGLGQDRRRAIRIAMAVLDLLCEVATDARCWSWPRMRSGLTARPRKCLRWSPAACSPIRSCCWPPCARVTRRCWLMPDCRSIASAVSRRRGDDAAGRVGAAALPGDRDRLLSEAGNPLALMKLPIAAARRSRSRPARCRSPSGSSRPSLPACPICRSDSAPTMRGVHVAQIPQGLAVGILVVAIAWRYRSSFWYAEYLRSA